MKQNPIIILSFNRPDYLRAVLQSLLLQKDANIDDRTIALFQDGALNAKSNRSYANQIELDACVTVFQELVPRGYLFQSHTNLGIALNYDRAEKYAFETLNADAAIFLEDDLVLSENYIAVLDRLIAIHTYDLRVGYVAAYGDHTLDKGDQLSKHTNLITMHHNWGFGLYNRQWKQMRPYVEEYLAIVSQNDYRMRDHIGVAKLFSTWGFGAPATSQDAAKTLACCLTRTIKVNTVACFARYIGEHGVHMNAADYRAQNYAGTYIFPTAIDHFEKLTDNLYHQIRADLVHWGGRPATSISAPKNQEEAKRLFHATNDNARSGKKNDAIQTATAALTALFSPSKPGRKVLIDFHPISSIRDVANEHHVRFDLRRDTLRIICPSEMVAPHFTNFLHAFIVASALVDATPLSQIHDGGFTMDLGCAVDIGKFKRIAFSSALAQAKLVLDPDFYLTHGYQALREFFAKQWRPWSARRDTAFWRGRSTGLASARSTAKADSDQNEYWKCLQRLQLCALSRQSKYSAMLDVGLSQIVQLSDQGILSAIAKTDFIRGPEPDTALIDYRYAFAIDGNSSAGNGLIQAMLAGACVLLVESSTGHRSWFYDRLVPGNTHVTIRADFTDFEEKMMFVFENPDLCERIALQGRALAEQMSFEVEFEKSVQTMTGVITL